MDIQNLTASILLADLRRRGFFLKPGEIHDIIKASKAISNLIYADDIDRDAGGEPEMAEPNLVTIMDPPDAWGVRHNMGLAELAARLGSPITHDRRGNVIWYDDFESGICNWIGRGSGVAWEVSWSAKTSRRGAFSCYMATTPLIGAYVGIEKYIAYASISNTGLEISIANVANWDYMLMGFIHYTRTDRRTLQVKYEQATGKWYYYDALGAPIYTGTTVKLEESIKQANIIKLVYDASLREYKHLIVNGVITDLSGIPLLIGGTTGFLDVTLRIYIYSDSNAAAEAYVDDVIITQNEP